MISVTEVARLYVATFNRAPDAAGLAYWVYDSNLSAEQVAQSFFDQSETRALYPAGTTTTQKVTSAYQNLFNRLPDAEGLAYWVAQIDSGAVEQSSMLLALINGALGDDAAILEHKTQIGLYFADAGLNDTDWAAAVMSGVDESAQSVSEAKRYVDFLASPMFEEASAMSRVDTDTGTLPTLSTYGVEALDSGYYWSGDSLTYSFNTSIPSWYYTGEYASEMTSGWQPLSSAMRTAVHSIVEGLNELIDVEVRDAGTYGDIRFNVVDMEWGGFSFFPMENHEIDGDVFLTSEFLADPELYTLEEGGNGWTIIAHELGHSMGLKHPFEAGATLPASLDDVVHSIMSYTEYNLYALDFGIDSYGWIEYDYSYVNPALYSLYDIAALQTFYGADLDTRTGDDLYTLETPQYLCIWDAGGEDTVDCSSAGGECLVSLREGSFSSVDLRTESEQIADARALARSAGDIYSDDYIDEVFALFSDSLYTGENALSIAWGTIIENLLTGSGDDTVWDNAVDNVISTGAGNDTIYLGQGGWDTLDGGEGNDLLYLDITLASTSWSLVSEGYYRVLGNDFSAELIGIETVRFADASVHRIADLA